MRLLCATVLSILNRLRPAVERPGGSDAGIRKDADDEKEEEADGQEADGQEAGRKEEEEDDIKEAIVEGYPQALLEHRLTSRILTAAALCLGWGYGEGYPWPWVQPLSLLRLLGYGGKTNCSTFAAHIQFGLYPDVEWTEERYRELMVWDARLHGQPSTPWWTGKGRRVSVPNDKQWHWPSPGRRRAGTPTSSSQMAMTCTFSKATSVSGRSGE